jgi:acetyltransferase-like isoleucine patch superfamily enzyme
MLYFSASFFFKFSTLVKKIRAWHCQEKIKRTVVTYKEPLRVNGFTVLNAKTSLGKNTNFNGLEVSGGGEVFIGDNFHSGPDCLIITQNHNYDHGTHIPYDCTYILKRTVIEDNVWLGSRVIILGGVTIGEGAIIQAGSVVTQDIPKYAIAGGHPARVFKMRDVKHYERLKDMKQFN